MILSRVIYFVSVIVSILMYFMSIIIRITRKMVLITGRASSLLVKKLYVQCIQLVKYKNHRFLPFCNFPLQIERK